MLVDFTTLGELNVTLSLLESLANQGTLSTRGETATLTKTIGEKITFDNLQDWRHITVEATLDTIMKRYQLIPCALWTFSV